MIFIGFIFFFILIHELGHIIICEILGVKIFRITVRYMMMDLGVEIVRERSTPFNELIIDSGGFIAQFLFGLIFCSIGYLKKNLFIYINGYMGIFTGIIYWNMSIWFRFGDSYEIYKALPLSYDIFLILSFVFSVLFFIILVRYILICNEGKYNV